MRGPADQCVAHGLHEDRHNRNHGQDGQRRLVLDLIFGDVRLGADLAARVRIGPAAMTFLAAVLGLFVLREHGQAVSALQKENDGGENNCDDASALHALSVPDLGIVNIFNRAPSLNARSRFQRISFAHQSFKRIPLMSKRPSSGPQAAYPHPSDSRNCWPRDRRRPSLGSAKPEEDVRPRFGAAGKLLVTLDDCIGLACVARHSAFGSWRFSRANGKASGLMCDKAMRNAVIVQYTDVRWHDAEEAQNQDGGDDPSGVFNG